MHYPLNIFLHIIKKKKIIKKKIKKIKLLKKCSNFNGNFNGKK